MIQKPEIMMFANETSLLPVRTSVFHPYSDSSEATFDVLSYAYEEVFAEKVRALGDRTRPRDLYDVINLFRNDSERPSPTVLRDVIRQKCEYKGIPLPDLAGILAQRVELESTWEHMLGHQLPALPSLEGFINELPRFFAWLYRDEALQVLPAPPSFKGDVTLRDRTSPLDIQPHARSVIEVVRFAASNRLCVDLEYVDADGQRSARPIEPYSLRQSKDGNILLVAIRVDDGEVRSYRIDRISNVKVTNQQFTARYEVELTSNSPISFNRLNREAKPIRSLPSRPGGKSNARSAPSGPTYVYQCPYCHREFGKKSRSTKLRSHKDKQGNLCSGRTGYFVTTRG